jgi:hypothetical protein
MLQKRRQRHAEGFCQLSYSSGPTAKSFERFPSCGIGQSVEHAIQLRDLLVRHVPYYTEKEYLGQYLTFCGLEPRGVPLLQN